MSVENQGEIDETICEKFVEVRPEDRHGEIGLKQGEIVQSMPSSSTFYQGRAKMPQSSTIPIWPSFTKSSRPC